VTTDLLAFVRVLSAGGVDYIIVGGVAGNLHGALRTTLDLDVVYSRTPENVRRLVAALAPYHPYLRGAPAGLPFAFDQATVTRGLNFTLVTTLGDIDLLGEVAGGGRFEELVNDAERIEIDEVTCRVVSLPKLIALKRAAGRAKDREALAELEALLEERDRMTR
jgi:hypothetical protein